MNEDLKKENKLLKNQNIQLVTKLKSMQQCMNDLFKKNKRTSTAMLFISVLLVFFVYPGSETNEPELSKYESTYQTVPFKGIHLKFFSGKPHTPNFYDKKNRNEDNIFRNSLFKKTCITKHKRLYSCQFLY